MGDSHDDYGKQIVVTLRRQSAEAKGVVILSLSSHSLTLMSLLATCYRETPQVHNQWRGIGSWVDRIGQEG